MTKKICSLMVFGLLLSLTLGCAESGGGLQSASTDDGSSEESTDETSDPEESVPGVAADFKVTNQKYQTNTNGQQDIGTTTVPGDGSYVFPDTITPTNSGSVNSGSWIEILVHLEGESGIVSLPGGDWSPLVTFYNLLATNDSGVLRLCYQYQSGSGLYEFGYTASIYQEDESVGCGVIGDDGIGRTVSLTEGDSVTLVNVGALAAAPVDLEVDVMVDVD